jgi:hypothetical protein
MVGGNADPGVPCAVGSPTTANPSIATTTTQKIPMSTKTSVFIFYLPCETGIHPMTRFRGESATLDEHWQDRTIALMLRHSVAGNIGASRAG